jgi:hypothetical protein
MKSSLLLIALAAAQYPTAESSYEVAEDPAQWEGAQDPFESYEEVEQYEEPDESFEGDYEPGMYFAGNGIGSTPAERMVWAAANGPKSFNCKECKEDIACMTSCSTYVVRGKVTSLRRRNAEVEVLCNYKGTPALAKGAPAPKAAKAKKGAKKALAKKAAAKKAAKKGPPTEETVSEEDTEAEGEDKEVATEKEYSSLYDQSVNEEDYEDLELSFEDDGESRLVKRSKSPSKGVRVRIPKACAKKIRPNSIYTMFLVKGRRGFRLYGGRKACSIRDDTLTIQESVLKENRNDLQGPQCSIGQLAAKGLRRSDAAPISSSLLLGMAMAFL